MLTQATKLLTGLIPMKEDKEVSQMTRQHYEHIYVFSVMWSVGAFLELDDRAKMEEFIRGSEDFKLDLPDIPSDSDATMFDHFVDNDGECGKRRSVMLCLLSDALVAGVVEVFIPQ